MELFKIILIALFKIVVIVLLLTSFDEGDQASQHIYARNHSNVFKHNPHR